MNNKFFDYTIYSDDIQKVDFKQKKVISTLNAYSFLMAEKNKLFKEALLKFEYFAS